MTGVDRFLTQTATVYPKIPSVDDGGWHTKSDDSPVSVVCRLDTMSAQEVERYGREATITDAVLVFRSNDTDAIAALQQAETEVVIDFQGTSGQRFRVVGGPVAGINSPVMTCAIRATDAGDGTDQ